MWFTDAYIKNWCGKILVWFTETYIKNWCGKILVWFNLLKHILKYFRLINFQDIYFKEFKEKRSEYIS